MIDNPNDPCPEGGSHVFVITKEERGAPCRKCGDRYVTAERCHDEEPTE